jgi:hypothetical protein
MGPPAARPAANWGACRLRHPDVTQPEPGPWTQTQTRTWTWTLHSDPDPDPDLNPIHGRRTGFRSQTRSRTWTSNADADLDPRLRPWTLPGPWLGLGRRPFAATDPTPGLGWDREICRLGSRPTGCRPRARDLPGGCLWEARRGHPPLGR